jgi:hypothetical protein
MNWAATTTTVVNVHQGVPLPAGRVIVLLVPVLVLCFYVFIRTRRR